MRCEDLQARYLAGELDEAARAHLQTCAACRSARPGLDRLRDSLADPVLWEPPPPELADRVVAAVLAEARPPSASRGIPWRRFASVAAVLVVLVGVVAAATAWVSRPHWTVELTATEVAPEAQATVAGWNTDTGTRMELEVSGLEPSRDDGYYEVWLTAPDGRHVSAGTFRQAGEVTVWAGVSRSDFPRIWITYEPADEDPAPSGWTVLDTEVNW